MLYRLAFLKQRSKSALTASNDAYPFTSSLAWDWMDVNMELVAVEERE